MSSDTLHGVIAAIATPVTPAGKPDHARLVAHARHLLSTGCDALNLLGSTGEGTSFSLAERIAVMNAVAESGLPLTRFMVGTGAAATRDAAELTRAAAELGFAGALLLPPFYYKIVTDDGIARYVEHVLSGLGGRSIPLYLYHYPAMSQVPYSLSAVALLLERFGSVIAGIKDSSGDIANAEQLTRLSPHLRVFPSSEGTLLRAHAGDFAGCISATANLNAPHCAAAYRDGDEAALRRAVAVRELFNGLPFVASIKTVLARIRDDSAWTEVTPPLTPPGPRDLETLWARFDALPAETWR